MWRTTPKKSKPLPTKKAAAKILQLEEEEMEGADSDADGNTKAPYEVLRQQLGLSTVKKTVATTVKKSTTKTATPKESENIYRGAGQRHRPATCSQTEYGGLHYSGSPMVTPGGTDNC